MNKKLTILYAFALVLAWALLTAPWPRLKDNLQQNVWLGACVALMVLWSIKTGIRPGLNFHLLGATVFTLMFGPWLAIVGLGVVLLGVTAYGLSGWESFSVNGLLMDVLPVMTSYLVYRLVDSKLPNHFFVYIFYFYKTALANLKRMLFLQKTVFAIPARFIPAGRNIHISYIIVFLHDFSIKYFSQFF